MINVNEIRTNLEAVANALDESDEDSASRLRDLSYAVGGGSQSGAWAGSNIYQLIDPALIIERYQNQRRTDGMIATLEWLRNSLIFAPLVITWLGISQAVDKYQALILADHNQIAQPFIYLWQQGFGNRLPWFFTLGTLAAIDFGILLLVLVFTITVYTLSNTIKTRREQEAIDLRSRLTHALAGATLHFNVVDATQPTQLLTLFKSATQEFNTITSQLLKQMSLLADRQKNDWQAFDTLKTQLVTMVTSVSTSATEIKASNDKLSSAVNGLVSPTRDIATQQGTLSKNVQDAIQLFRGQITAQETVVKETQKWGTTLQGVLIRLEASVKANEQLTQNTSLFTRKQTDLVAAMERERIEQAEISNRVLMATESLKKVVNEINACGVELRGMNVQINDLVRRVAGMR